MQTDPLAIKEKFSWKKFFKSLPYKAIVTFIVSVIALGFGLQYIYIDRIYEKESLAVYPVHPNDTNIVSGTVVTFGEDGYLTRNTGTTVYKNAHTFKGKMMLNLQTVTLENGIVVCVFHAGILAVQLDAVNTVYLEKRSELPPIELGKPRQIDRIVHIENTNTVLIVGSSQIIPCFVTTDNKDIRIIFGEAVEYYSSPLDLKPEITLSNDGHLAILFTDNDAMLRLVTCKVNADGSHIQFLSSDIISVQATKYAVAYIQNSYLAITYTEFNTTSCIDSVHVVLGEQMTEGNSTIFQFDDTVLIEEDSLITFIDMDSWCRFNPNNTQLILSYITSEETDGLHVYNIKFNEFLGLLRLGPKMKNGYGGVTDVDTRGIHYLQILMLTRRRFIVYYSSMINNGFTALQVCYLSPAGELVTDGPHYIVSRGVSDLQKEYYYVSACEHNQRVFLFECLYKFAAVDTTYSILDIYNRPIGIVKSIYKQQATVILQGTYTLDNGKGDLVPGKYYYGNSLGDFIEGEWAGQRGIDSYYTYIDKDEEHIMVDVHNRIGLAISHKKLLVITKQLI